MKMIVLDLTDVDVKLVKFVKQDDYADFDDIAGRTVTKVQSEIDEIDKMRGVKPIGFFKQNDGSYILITAKKPTESVL